jgi:magnesium and cobalt exporter, CNNM family
MWALDLALIVVLVGANALFVAAEYSLLSIRRSRLEQLVRRKFPRALLVYKLLERPSLLFSGIQLGITLASLLLGWLGESLLAGLLDGLLQGHLERFGGPAAHTVATAAAFVLITGLLMVLGELAPKTLAYERAERVALLTAVPVTAFMRLAHYPVQFMDWLASAVTRLAGVEPSKGHHEAHTTEEVKLIVAGIRKRGMLGREQEEMIQSILDLHRVLVREIMVPRPRITCLPLTSDLPRLLEQIVEDQHSRIPIYEGNPDSIVGILYTKDLLRLVHDRDRDGESMDAPLDLAAMLHHPMIVPETMPLMQVLKESRRRQAQMALVVDEFGTFTGLVTIEDVLEQIVGEIQDEYDQAERAILKVGENLLVMDASLSLRELADDHEIVLPRDGGYETLGGFVLARLGAIPKGGETFVFSNWRFTVLEMEGRRVARVQVERIPDLPAGPVRQPANGASHLRSS